MYSKTIFFFLIFLLLVESATAQTDHPTFLKAQKAFQKHSYNEALQSLEDLKQKEAKNYGEPAKLLEAQCHQALNNYYQVISLLESQIDQFQNQDLKLQGHLLLSKAYITYNNNMSSRILRHFEIPFQFFNEQFKKDGSKKKELLETLFDVQEALSQYWDYSESHQKWQEEFNKLTDEKKNWNVFFQNKQRELAEKRIQKLVQIYDYIREVGGKDSHEAARALFLKGCFYTNIALDQYRQAQYYSVSELSEQIRKSLDQGILAFRAVPAKDELADDAQFLACYTLHHKKNDLVAAKEAYTQFLTERSRSKWASDARHYYQQIMEEEINLQIPRVFAPGEKITLNLQTRNTTKIQFELRKVNVLNSFPDYNYDSAAKEQARIQLDKRIEPQERWLLQTGIKDDYVGIAKELEIPNRGPGIYVLTGTGTKKQSQAIIVVSNVVLITHQARERLLNYVVDSQTGKPIANASVAARLYFSYQNSNSREDKVSGTTDANGLFSADLSRFGNFYSYSTEVVAVNADHAALHSDNYSNYSSYENRIQVLAYTNQPVYRPGQKVEFKLIFRGRENGEVKNIPSKMVALYIQDPLGNKVYNKTVYTNAYGTISDSFELKSKEEKPALGTYNIIAQIDGNTVYQENYSYPHFNVEEYKKPEFLVSVAPVTEQATFGEEIKAKIHGEYYFGGPVVGGTVNYTIYVSPHYTSYNRREEYSWYQRSGRGRRQHNEYEYYGREHIASVQNQSLDENGDFEVTFQSQQRYGENVDQVYTIEAQVVDKSRRMVNGQGSVYVTHRGFTVFLDAQKEIYLRGETAQIDVIAKTANGTPVAFQGEFLVELQEGDAQTPTYKELLRDPIKVDESGKTMYSFIPDEEGYFRVTLKTKDAKGLEVAGQTNIWVVSKDFRGDQSRFSDVNLISDKSSYRIGEKANILLTSHLPDSYALISVTGDQSLTDYQVIRVAGKTGLFSITIREAHTPNIFVQALVIKGNKVYQNVLEIAVPPLQCFGNVEIKSNKESYLPGELAKITVKTTDYQGNPIPMEVSLGTVDASLYYIAPDSTPDIRQFLYGNLRENRLAFRSSLQFSYSATASYLPGFEQKYFSTNQLPDAYYRAFQGIQGLGGAAFAQNEDSEGGGKLRAREEPASPLSAISEKSMVSKDEASSDGPSRQAENKKAAGKPSANMKESAESNRRDSDNGAPEFQEAKVRTDFKDNCFWIGQIVTDSKGEATMEIPLPDNLTTWTLTSRAIDLKNRVGFVQKNILTQKHVLIRPQQPRFFRERDWVTLSAIVQNNLSEDLDVKVALTIDDQLLTMVPMADNEKEQTIKVRGKKDYRLDWVVSVRGEGKTTIKMSALTTVDSDAVEQSFPVYLHGIEKFLSTNGVMTGENNQLAGDQSHSLLVNVPAERIPESTRLTLNFSPTMASVILEALPYLAQYPYGCVEQTMSRFLPSVLAAKTLKQLGFSFEETLPNAKNYSPDHPRFANMRPQACLNDKVLSAMVEQGKLRLYDFQHSDGGWGWWKKDTSNLYMTSYVLFGLNQARQAGVSIESDRIMRGGQFLLNQLQQVNLKEDREIGNSIEGNRFAYMLFSLSTLPEIKDEIRKHQSDEKFGFLNVLNFLFSERDVLNDYGRSLLALTLKNIGKANEAKDLLAQIMDHAVPGEDGTVHFGEHSNYYYWYQDGIESSAYALKALVAIEPSNPAISKIAKWLSLRRTSGRWNSTKDTAMAIYGLLDYLTLTGEMNPSYTLRVRLGNKVLKTIEVNKANLFTLENEIVFSSSEIETGTHTFVIEKEGAGNLYYSASLSFFTLEEDIRPEKTEIELQRT
ncbi:MAG: alpha-2-macroglobulin family protein, partial [Planctomycetota bacterium]